MTYLILLTLHAALLFGSDLPIPRLLSVDSRKAIQAVDFPSYGDTQCDEDGNLFFHASNGLYDNPELAEIVHDGQSGPSFKLPADVVKSTTFDRFFVSPDGHVYLLVQASKTERLLFPFDKKGEPGDPIHVETPGHLTILDLVVFDDSSFLVRGFYNQAADSDGKGSTYVAIYEPSGRFRKQLSQDTTGSDKITEGVSKFPGGAATLGDDGSLYFVTSERVTVLSSGGSVVRHFDFPRLDSEWSITRANVSKGLLALTFSRVNRKHAIEERYLILSTISGDVVGWYQPTEETGSINVCFKNGKDFVFLISDKADKLYLLTAPIQ